MFLGIANVFKIFNCDIYMTNKTLLAVSLLLILFCLVTVTAQEKDIRFYHEISTNLTIYETCRIDGGICDSTYNCSLSVLSPQQSLIIDNETMLGTGVYRNFSLNSTLTDPNGIYESTVDCSNSTFSGSNTFYYQVTPTGSQPIDTGQGLILAGAIAILILLSLFSGFLGFKSSNTTIMLSFLSLSILLAVFSLGFVLNIIQSSFGTFSAIIDNYSTIFIVFTVLISVGAVGLMLYIIYIALLYYWNLRGMRDTFSINPDG